MIHKQLQDGVRKRKHTQGLLGPMLDDLGIKDSRV